MAKDVYSIIETLIKETLKEYLPEKDFPKITLDTPKDKTHGDLSCNVCHIVAKRIDKKSFDFADDFAQKLQTKIAKSKIKDDVVKIQALRGFINVSFSHDYFCSFLKELLKDGNKFLKTDIGKSKLVNIEFVSANPTGPLSVAHARQAAVGDSLANLLGILGFRVVREYFINDEGRQIELLGQSIFARFQELIGQKSQIPEEGYQGQYISDLAKELLEAKGDKVKDKDINFFIDYGVERILSIIKKELEDFGVRFDKWSSQKDIRKSKRVDKVLTYLKKKNLTYEEDAAVWFKSTQFGDDKDRVVVKSNKSYTYLAPDIAYHQDKFQRRFKWVINLWGPDHHGYIVRIKAAVQALGYPKDAISVVIIQLATLYRGKEVIPMSTRKGQYITLRQLMDEVGKDTARFFLLMRKTDSHLDFDLELAKKHTLENPVYYVQYAHARIINIIKNADSIKQSDLLNVDLSLLKEPEEIQLIKCLCSAKEVLLSCHKILDVYPIVVYLQELAAIFHRFYERCRVVGEKQEIMHARLALLEATRIVFSSYLNLLGVSVPEKM